MVSVLTCTDGSIYSESTYDHSIWVAQQLEAEIHLLHMLDPELDKTNHPDYTGNIGMDTRKEMLKDFVEEEGTKARLAREHGKMILENGAQYLKQLCPELKTVAIQKHGNLLESVENLDPTVKIIVMGKRGEHADFETMNLGSNLEEAVRNSKKPILIASRKFKSIRKMTLCFDDSPSANKALEFLTIHKFCRGFDIEVIHIGNENPAIKQQLDNATTLLNQTGAQAKSSVLEGSPTEAITKYIENEGTDLLVMGSYGHSKIREMIFGSTTTNIIKSVQVPVFMFH